MRQDTMSRRAFAAGLAAAAIGPEVLAPEALAQESSSQAPRPFRAGTPWSAPRANASLPLNLSFRTLNGDTTLGDMLQERPGIINVWATWCGPCRAEKPALNRFARQEATRGDRVAILSVLAYDEAVTRIEQLEAAYRRFSAPALTPLLATPETERALVAYFGSGSQRSRTALPSTTLIDAQGHDMGRIVGAAVLGAAARPYWTDPLAEQMVDRLIARPA